MRNVITCLTFAICFNLSSPVMAETLSSFKFSKPELQASNLLIKQEATNFDNTADVMRSSGSNVYQSVLPSVVKVLTNDGSGSGFVISDQGNGLIITNDHVTTGYSSVGIIFPNDKGTDKVTIGTVIKFDEISDLSLISLNGSRPDILPIMVADGEPNIGDEVHAIGHPVGEDWTYTRGYVSQKLKNYSWHTSETQHHIADVIQTQTPINPGNSGGPLFNSKGELVGVNSFGKSDYEGMSFSIALSSLYSFLSSTSSVERQVLDSSDLGKIVNSLDENQNGNPDVYFLDASGNEYPDMMALDEDENLFSEWLGIDDNENGIFEIVMFEYEYEGDWIIIYEFDEDEDDEPETVGFDLDRDGKIDEVVPYQG